MFASCFRMAEGVGDGGGGGGLMGELTNLQMDHFSDICQGFNKWKCWDVSALRSKL